MAAGWLFGWGLPGLGAGVLSWANLFLSHIVFHPPVSYPCRGLRALQSHTENHRWYVSVMKPLLISHPLMAHWPEQVLWPCQSLSGVEGWTALEVGGQGEAVTANFCLSPN